jgi:hypothetical protein
MMNSMMKWAGRMAAAVALAVAAPACVVGADTVVAGSGPTGTLTARWSVAGAFDNRVCANYGANQMELVILDASGRQVANAYQPCEQFEMTVEMPVGTYTANATLLGYDNRPVSTTLPVQAFRIVRDTDIFIDTDFPADSLYTAQ